MLYDSKRVRSSVAGAYEPEIDGLLARFSAGAGNFPLADQGRVKGLFSEYALIWKWPTLRDSNHIYMWDQCLYLGRKHSSGKAEYAVIATARSTTTDSKPTIMIVREGVFFGPVADSGDRKLAAMIAGSKSFPPYEGVSEPVVCDRKKSEHRVRQLLIG
jgi:hypothetical protein